MPSVYTKIFTRLSLHHNRVFLTFWITLEVLVTECGKALYPFCPKGLNNLQHRKTFSSKYTKSYYNRPVRRGKERGKKRNKDKQSLSGTRARTVLLEMHLHQGGNKESVSLDYILTYFTVLFPFNSQEQVCNTQKYFAEE